MELWFLWMSICQQHQSYGMLNPNQKIPRLLESEHLIKDTNHWWKSSQQQTIFLCQQLFALCMWACAPVWGWGHTITAAQDSPPWTAPEIHHAHVNSHTAASGINTFCLVSGAVDRAEQVLSMVRCVPLVGTLLQCDDLCLLSQPEFAK